MRTVPFILSGLVSAVCLVLSAMLFLKTNGNREIKTDLIKQQADNQILQQEVKEQEEEAQRQNKVYQVTAGIAQLRQGDLQRQQQILETGASIDQKFGPEILRNIGVLAARNNNEKLKQLLAKHNWEMFIPSAEDLKKLEEQVRQGQPNQPAPVTPPRPGTNPPR